MSTSPHSKRPATARALRSRARSSWRARGQSSKSSTGNSRRCSLVTGRARGWCCARSIALGGRHTRMTPTSRELSDAPFTTFDRHATSLVPPNVCWSAGAGSRRDPRARTQPMLLSALGPTHYLDSSCSASPPHAHRRPPTSSERPVSLHAPAAPACHAHRRGDPG